ncbi:MAG TPA: DUF2510 domain-containing protein [Terrimesophilobacter sp.]|nr:DUF2510 domain-containing protein [Terrimesophilobacter sp.]
MLGQSELPGAAWYPDPYGASTLRWWDGVQWTDAVHPPVGAPAPAASHAPTMQPAAEQPIPAQPTPQQPASAQSAPAHSAVPAAASQPTADGRTPDGSTTAFPYLSQMGAQPPQPNPVVSEVVTAPSVAPAAPPTQQPAAAEVNIPGPVAAASASTSLVPGGHVTPPPTPLGLRAAATTLDEDTGSGGYEWSRESRAFDTFPGSAMPVSIAPRTTVTSDVVTNTASSWTIVFMPLLAVIGIVAVMLVIASVPALPTTGFPSELLLISVAVAFYLITTLFALADNRRLYSNGVDRPPHWAWSLLSAPIYLIARVVAVKRETGRTKLGQLIVHVLLLAGGVFLALNFTEVVFPYLVSIMESLL